MNRRPSLEVDEPLLPLPEEEEGPRGPTSVEGKEDFPPGHIGELSRQFEEILRDLLHPFPPSGSHPCQVGEHVLLEGHEAHRARKETGHAPRDRLVVVLLEGAVRLAHEEDRRQVSLDLSLSMHRIDPLGDLRPGQFRKERVEEEEIEGMLPAVAFDHLPPPLGPEDFAADRHEIVVQDADRGTVDFADEDFRCHHPFPSGCVNEYGIPGRPSGRSAEVRRRSGEGRGRGAPGS